MSNALRGEADLAVKADVDRGIDANTYTLSFDINALCEAEDATGLSTSAILNAMGRDLSMKVLRGLVWAGLQRHHPDCTLFDAGDIINAAGAVPAREAMSKALVAAFPPPTKEKVKNPPKAAAGAT